MFAMDAGVHALAADPDAANTLLDDDCEITVCSNSAVGLELPEGVVRGSQDDHAAVLGPIHPVSKVGHFTKGAISLAVNGKVRQDSDLSKMIWSVAEQISKLSEAFELKAGDIIYSGTPANVGPVVKDDVLLCKLDGLPDMSIKIV